LKSQTVQAEPRTDMSLLRW